MFSINFLKLQESVIFVLKHYRFRKHFKRLLRKVTVVLNAIAESAFPVNAVAVCAVLADAHVLLLFVLC